MTFPDYAHVWHGSGIPTHGVARVGAADSPVGQTCPDFPPGYQTDGWVARRPRGTSGRANARLACFNVRAHPRVHAGAEGRMKGSHSNAI